MTRCNRFKLYEQTYLFIILVLFTNLFQLIGYQNIHTPITCIVHVLSVLGVAQNIRVMGSLQDDK